MGLHLSLATPTSLRQGNRVRLVLSFAGSSRGSFSRVFLAVEALVYKVLNTVS